MAEIKIESEDCLEAKYEILGKLLQREKEGLADLEREKPAERRRQQQTEGNS